MADSPKKTILIVHRDPVEAAAWSATFLGRGFRTFLAENADEAKAMMHKHIIDCVLCPDRQALVETITTDGSPADLYLIPPNGLCRDSLAGRLCADDVRPLHLGRRGVGRF